MEKVAVIFRVWKKTGDVIAFFPEIPADYNGYLMSSYEHIGQHGAADYFGLIPDTYLATRSEYAELKKELTSIGYKLKVVFKETQKMRAIRKQVVKLMR